MGLGKKKEKVEELGRLLRTSPASFVVDYRGLNVAELTELRIKLRERGATLRVVKNTLVRRSIQGGELEGLARWFSGPTGIIFVQGNPSVSAKVLVGFLPDHPNLNIKGGLLDGGFLEEDKVKTLGKLPSREILLSQILSLVQLPLARLTRVLNSPLQQLICVLNSISAKGGG